MAWALVFLFLLTYCTGHSSQQTISQPASASVPLGQTVKLSCSRSAAGSGSWYSFGWYQQKMGQAPRLVFYGSSTRGEGIPDRFSGSASGDNAHLTITNVQAEDEADYFCGAFYYSSNTYRFVFGGGTHLTVTGQPAVPPSVSLFPPSQEEIKSKNKATLACLMDGFHPGVVQVEWKSDGSVISSGVETSKPVKQGDKYVASSYLMLSSTDWQSHETYTCKVTHEGKTIEKVVNRSQCS